MARKNTGESPISLFSFQDIITSITGIMFLVVLFLILIMLTSRPDTRQHSSENIQELQKELADLKAKLQQLRSNSQSLDKQLEELKKLDPKELERQKEYCQQMISQTRASLEKITLQVNYKSTQVKELRQEHLDLQKLIKLKKQVINDLQLQLAEISKTVKQKEEISRQRKRVMKYVIHSSTPKRPVLAELDKDGIRLMDVDKKKFTDLRRNGRGAESLSMLVEKLADFDPVQVYFTVAVKPGGFKYAMQVLDILKKNNFERGTEILPDDNTSIFEEPKP